MHSERDFIPIVLGLTGLFAVGYAISLTLSEVSGNIFYVFLAIQAVVLIYLLIVVLNVLKETWTNYRWSPDRLR
ncbi:MAG TPA: hypothetical protein ENH13_04785 [Euryarchaeota archaeon]|nr:hypothetical protein [Euryarchaeota archaeon]